MADSSPGQRPTPLVAAGRHRIICALSVLLGILGGTVFTYSQPVLDKAEIRLAVASNNMSAQLVPGFAQASQELVSNYARYVNTEGIKRDLTDAIGAPAGSVADIVASPIPESNVLRIEVQARSPRVAAAAAQRVADDLMKRVNTSRLDDTAAKQALDQYTRLSQQVAEAQQAVAAAQAALDRVVGARAVGDVTALRGAVAAAQAQQDILRVQQEAVGTRYQSLVADNAGTAGDIEVVRPVQSVGDDRNERLLRYAVLGAVIGGLLGVAVSVVVEHRRRAGTAGRPTVAARAASTRAPVEDVHGEEANGHRPGAADEGRSTAQWERAPR